MSSERLINQALKSVGWKVEQYDKNIFASFDVKGTPVFVGVVYEENDMQLLAEIQSDIVPDNRKTRGITNFFESMSTQFKMNVVLSEEKLPSLMMKVDMADLKNEPMMWDFVFMVAKKIEMFAEQILEIYQ
ncbi:MAG: hypothetical protein MJZ68_09050 [archaeon]|nr:hypothetical protein [archaeon]